MVTSVASPYGRNKGVYCSSGVSSKRFWKFFMSAVLATMLLQQYWFSQDLTSAYYSELLASDMGMRQEESLGQRHVTWKRMQMHLIMRGEQWKIAVRDKLKHELQKRFQGIHANSTKGQEITRNFERLHKRVDEVKASEIYDQNYWHSVTPEGYKETLEKARSSMEEIVDDVYTDCILWLVPNPKSSVMEVETDDRNAKKEQKNQDAGPLIRFQCGGSSSDHLREKPCRSANLCLVRSDPLQWRAYYESTSSNTVDSSKKAIVSRYNHTDLEHRFLTSRKDNYDEDSTGPSRSAILTMVDTVNYLRTGTQTTGKKARVRHFIWDCFLNKASYAFRTNRDFYIWIGGFKGGKGDVNSVNANTNATSVLHQRNTDILVRTFGSDCKPEDPNKNVVHYYKPVAFGALFRLLRSQKQQHRQGSSKGDHRVWFLDADVYFNKEAFPSPRSHKSSNIVQGGIDDESEPMSLDDYFALSPQASLLGSQNPSGKEGNILINGGLLGLRGSATEPDDPLDDWVLNLSSLWWYCRCGERDQIALWLLLYATWSAESSTIEKFAYPGVAFESYVFSWLTVIPHAWEFLPKLQSAWSRETTGVASASSSSSSSPNDAPIWKTTPTDTSLFDGGEWFANKNRSGIYTYPLELPHVLLIPLDPFELPPESSKKETNYRLSQLQPRSDFYLGIVRKNQPEKKALLTHSKNVRNVCYDIQCWPFVIRHKPKDLPTNMPTKNANKKKKKPTMKPTKKPTRKPTRKPTGELVAIAP